MARDHFSTLAQQMIIIVTESGTYDKVILRDNVLKEIIEWVCGAGM